MKVISNLRVYTLGTNYATSVLAIVTFVDIQAKLRERYNFYSM